jgi:molybdopterin/thiamine biosynthesis adenylyltransferase
MSHEAQAKKDLIAERFLRQKNIADPEKMNHQVTILGVGAIGSAAAIAVAKMGTPKGITLVDYDTFAEHNIPNQFCLESEHAGKLKVEAIGDLCVRMGHIGTVTKHASRLLGNRLMDEVLKADFDAAPIAKGIVINTPDSMAARKDLWELCKYNPDVALVIDARMAGQYLQIITANPMVSADIKRYEKMLISDEEATPEDCSARAVIYTSFMAGGLIAGLVKKGQLGETAAIPQQIDFDLATMQLSLIIQNGAKVSNGTDLAIATVGGF